MLADYERPDLPPFQRALLAARAGDREALGAILKNYERVLLHAARERLPHDLQSKGGASDLIQDTFLDAQRDFPRFAGTTEADLLAWLRCLLRHNFANFVRDYRRRERRSVSREEPLRTDPLRVSAPERDFVSKAPGPRSDAIRRESSERCRRALARLPDIHRELIRLRLEDDLSYAAIGARMNMSEEAARKLFGRILRAVGAAIEAT
jgi:RNA polymerase sigma-70 factor (ECF subfamily)